MRLHIWGCFWICAFCPCSKMPFRLVCLCWGLLPSQTNGVMWSMVSLVTTLLQGSRSPLSCWPILCTFFRQKLTTALLKSADWCGPNDPKRSLYSDFEDQWKLFTENALASMSHYQNVLPAMLLQVCNILNMKWYDIVNVLNSWQTVICISFSKEETTLQHMQPALTPRSQNTSTQSDQGLHRLLTSCMAFQDHIISSGLTCQPLKVTYVRSRSFELTVETLISLHECKTNLGLRQLNSAMHLQMSTILIHNIN